jgi:hypothetical protein
MLDPESLRGERISGAYRVQRLCGVPIWRQVSKSLGPELISPPIGQALAGDASQSALGALEIVLSACVVTEIEFRSVAVQMASLRW